MFGMANPEIPEFSGGWVPVAAALLVAAILLAVKLTSHRDSTGDQP